MYPRSGLRPGQTRREAGTQSQGSSPEDRPDAGVKVLPQLKGVEVKADLARFTWVIALLTGMALTNGAWMRW
jgi:hypothetical protein